MHGVRELSSHVAQDAQNSGKSGAAGHRARLRERLLGGGAEALADYEVLEYLLFGALARGDTKPQAKALLARFGTLAGVLNAEPAALKQVKGDLPMLGNEGAGSPVLHILLEAQILVSTGTRS